MSTLKVRNRSNLVDRVKSLLGEGRVSPFPRPGGCMRRLSATVEPLEARTLLASLPYISEFMAWNDSTLKDEDGDYPGWIEIANPGVEPFNLTGYHLTDDKTDLDKWEFPAVTIAGGGYLVVFVAKDEPTAGTQLRTNFKLSDSGEYLALVAADGTTVVSSFDPKYPTQKEDISYGIATDVSSSGLLPTETPLRVRVPTSSSLGSSWTGVGFNDNSWRSGKGGVGYDLWSAPPPIPGFTVKMVDFDGTIGDVTTAKQILDGPLPPGYTLRGQYTKDYRVVNHGPGPANSFFPDELLPDGLGDGDTYALRFTANVVIPSGTWTIDVASDDGFMLTIPGVSFATRSNENYNNVGGGIVANRLVYSAPRGHNHTSGSFTVPAGGLTTTLTLDFYENDGGDDVELSIAPGQQAFSLGSFVLLSNGVLPGWSVKTSASTPPPDYRPLIQTNVESEMRNHNSSAYIRIPLKVIDNPDDYDILRLRVKYDDGFVAYLNGQRIAFRNAPESPAWNSAALGSRPDTQAIVYEDIDIPLPAGLLVPDVDTNVLAIQAMNESAGEEDFLFSVDLLGLTILEQAPRYFSQPTPGAANAPSSISEVVADTKFSHPRGFYDQPFNLGIESATLDAQIRYTLDGSTPTATTGTVHTRGTLIPISGTTTVRAAAFKPGAIATDVDTVTYLFTGDVIRQSANGQAPAGWPASWSPNTTDYGMDPDVVNSPLYAGEIEGALKSIPTFSIVTDLSNLFGSTGIYSYPRNQGRTWERPASVELIYPDGTEGFQSNAGLRIRGGFSRDPSNPKHAFRLFFRDEYGNGKLNYPLFGANGAQSFDNIDLRTFQNYSWSFRGDSKGIFIRDQLNRDVQLAMGQPATRGNFYHLYINGQYWGLYNTEERPEASYGESYFGGDKDDYDVIKQNGGGSITATDGNMLAWTDLWNQIKGDMTSNANYMRVRGLNVDGTRNANYPVLLDVDNLIDYMLVIFWGGNFDAPLSWFMGETGVNNFYAVRNRNGNEGFRFFIHDAEHTMVHPNSTDVNVYLNADRTGPLWQNPNPGLSTSNPQYMWQYLAANTEFRMAAADRMHKWFHNGGVLSANTVTAMFNARISEIQSAVVGESARWGDAKRGTPLTRNNEWQAEVDKLRTGHLPFRSGVVFNQLVADGFYPSVAAPVFSQFGGAITLPFNLTITNSSIGQVYYTLDGSDPRAIGGGLTTEAILYNGVSIRLAANTVVKARIKVGEDWSALTEATFYNDLSGLRITEIMYDPAPGAGTTDAQEYEFVELINTGPGQLDLTDVSFTAGIDYPFPDGTKLASQGRIVVAKNASAFAERYPGVTAIGFYPTKYLGNNGDRLTITGPGGVLLDFRFKDWYDVTKGQGYALVAIDPAVPLAQYGLKSNWRTGDRVNGGPGLADPGTNPDSVVINEVMSNTTGSDGDWIELYNTTDQEINIGGWYLSNDPADLTTYRIAAGTKIPAHDFLVFTEKAQFGNPADPGVRTAFSLSRLGDDAFLSSNNGSLGVGGYRDAVDFGASATEVTFGRHIKSTGGKDITAMSAPTRKMPNAAPAVGPVIISEIMYHPIVGHEFIELLNLTGADLPLYDTANPQNIWKLTEGVEYTFPDRTKLPPFGYALVVGIDPDLFRATYNIPASVPIFGPYADSGNPSDPLDDGGENVKLARPGTPQGVIVPYITVDMVHYDDKDPWPAAADGMGPSLSRRNPTDYGNDAGNWVAGPFGGTPGSAFLPPKAPAMLTAAGLSGSAIRLNWIDQSSTEDGLHIERSDDGQTFKRVGLATANATSFDDNTLSSGKFYTYRIRAYNGASESPYSNTFSASTLVVEETILISLTDLWRFNQARTPLDATWITTTYNDTTTGWGQNPAPAPFYYETDPLPVPKNTLLTPGPTTDRTPTFYFRKHFTLDVDPSMISSVRMRVVVDDGLVAYFNGDPAHATYWGVNKIPAPTYGSWANRSVPNAMWEETDPVDPTWLKKGDNVIAVMVKQINITSSDVVFGLELYVARTIGGLMGDIVDVQPDPGSDAVDSIAISFPEAVTGLDLADLRLTRGAGGNLLTGQQTLTSSPDGKTWTLGNLSPLTNIAGDYLLHLVANGSGIVGSTPARTLAADAIEAFRVTATNLTGTAAADQYYIRANGANLEIFTTVPPGATPTYSSPLEILSGLAINSGDGNDVIHIAGTLPLAPAINAGLGSDKLILDSGSHSFSDELMGPWSIEQLDVRGAATISFTASQVLEQLFISGDGSVQLVQSASRTLSVGQLSIADNAVLDIHDNGLIVRGMSLPEVSALVRSAQNGSAGAWSGSGITSALAKTGSYKGVAAIQNERSDGTPLKPTFLGTAVASTDLLVKCTWNGDANLDGLVNADDYFQIDSGFISQKKGWYNGDFNYDGVINADDYFLIDSAFIGQTGKLAATGPTRPEPTPGDSIAQPAPDAGWTQPQVKKEPVVSVLAQLFSTAPVL